MNLLAALRSFNAKPFYYGVPVLVIFIVIWFPILRHYYVPGITISEEILESARRLPDGSLFVDISKFSQGAPNFEHIDTEVLANAAENVLRGKFELSGWPTRRISMPFNPSDIDKGPSNWQLRYSSLIVPRLLLTAYEKDGREKFLLAARDFILAWADYEKSAWLPRGRLWNDHATAARVLTLANFWRLYRHNPSYHPNDARKILEHVARTGKILAHPDHYTFATNHGIMQNLALLHLYLSFPMIPEFQTYKTLALERLEQQIAFYINDEGVILEHSAEYHRSGLELLATTFRYLTLLNVPIPDEWKQKYEKAKIFYSQLRRPDGSLPLVGDTKSSPYSLPMVTTVNEQGKADDLYRMGPWKPVRPNSLYPAAGYSIWWDGLEHWPKPHRLSQTVVSWSYYPGHAHKHADELSVNLWAQGKRWWTSAGYWPYGILGRSRGISWEGSNAPHLVNEPSNSLRHSKLLRSGWSNGLAAIDLERRTPSGFVVRRQVIFVKPNLWLILDSFSDTEDRRVRTIWTADPGVSYRTGSFAGVFQLTRPVEGDSMTVQFLGSPDPSLMVLQGSTEPHAGWVTIDNKVTPAPAFILEQPSRDSWSTVVSLLAGQNGLTLSGRTRMLYSNAEHWQLFIPTSQGALELQRDDVMLSLRSNVNVQPSARLLLENGPNVSSVIASTREAYSQAEKKYGDKFSPRMNRRWKIFYVLLGLLGLQEALFTVYNWRWGRYSATLRVVSIPAWLALGVWVSTIYLR